ncbi:MAG: dihydroorotate dehydrogenase electron transfer subunit [Clostridiales bacterium]|nr:dihydroorotate dehydrogenase electron transfer subunit [Clostridiales bacterium]
MKKEYRSVVVFKQMLNQDTAFIILSCPEIAASAVPGQFVNISCSGFLKRPFGIASVNKNAGTFSIGVKVVGKGTTEIAAFKEGQEVSVLGPLGNGFDLSSEKYILVAGGTGVFPINFAHETLSSMGKKHVVVEGFRTIDQAVMTDDSFILTTDDGSSGIHGNCCDGLNTLSEDDLSDATVLCVGPLPMMKAVSAWAEAKGLSCYVSMEQRMACGIGICLVCVCKIKAEKEGMPFDHKRCCKDGPVFDSKEVVW